jgi:hypothetical protein
MHFATEFKIGLVTNSFCFAIRSIETVGETHRAAFFDRHLLFIDKIDLTVLVTQSQLYFT